MKLRLTIRVPLVPGRCRWCGCTYDNPCANGCGWTDRTQTLCTECAPLDTAMDTAKGRRALAELVQEYGELGDQPAQMAAHARPSATVAKGRRR